MLEVTDNRPQANEYAPYYEKYIVLVPEGDIVATLGRQLESTLTLLRGLSEAQGNSRYAADKWSIKEVVGHIIDSERIFGYRALRFARNDRTPLPGYEQDDYVSAGDFNTRPLSELADEFESLRRSNLSLFGGLGEQAWLRRGFANDTEASVRAVAYIIAGHETHHMQIVRTRYLEI